MTLYYSTECIILFLSNPALRRSIFFEKLRYLHKADLKVRVGSKETEEPILVCYCFGYTRKMIEDDFLRNGRSTIQKEITKKVKEGKCRCEVMNPQGTCCLGDVAQVLKHQGFSKSFSKGGGLRGL